MSGLGAWPVNAATPVGMFRFLVGDVIGTPADPATDPQTAEFEFLSDAAIEEFIAANPNSLDMAKAQALQSMASQLIISAQDIQVDDIRIKTVERARLMMELAMGFSGGAIVGDADTAFQIVPTNSNQYYTPPQGTPWPGGF